MSITDRLFGRGRAPRVALDLGALTTGFAANVSRFEGQDVEPDLVRARLADHCRDAGLEPMLPEEFDGLVENLDDESWRRLALAVSALDLPAVRQALPEVLGVRPLCAVIAEAFVRLARETPLLTLELLRQSPLRIEEFARQFLARLGAAVRGETHEVSRARLARLDYAWLLAEAEQAKVSAEERMEYIRKLQEQQEARRSRRGKW
jgi:hypothetical protein